MNLLNLIMNKLDLINLSRYLILIYIFSLVRLYLIFIKLLFKTKHQDRQSHGTQNPQPPPTSSVLFLLPLRGFPASAPMASLLLVPRLTRNPCSNPGPSAGHKPRPVSITCGPRDNRGPLQRGRSLSTEAILAIQSLKRLTSADRSPAAASAAAATALGRLLKADLVAAMAELQRQGHWSLALAALHIARAEPWYRPDPALYATFVSSAPHSPSGGEGDAEAAVDALVEAFLEEKARGGGFVDGEEDVYKLTRLLRALVAKGRGRAAWRVYEAAVRKGGLDVDEYVYRVMARGMKRLGFHEEAAEVEADFAEWETTVSPPARDVLDEMRARDEIKTTAAAS